MHELRTLFSLGKGIDKRWIWKTPQDFKKSRCLLRKIDFTINDLNREIPYLKTPLPKEVVYTIVMIDWIREAFDTLVSCCRPDVITSFSTINIHQHTLN